METSWAQLRTSLRSLEGQTDAALRTYSGLVLTCTASPSDLERATEAQIQDFMRTREGCIVSLQRVLDSEGVAAGGTKLHHLQRHREVLSEHQQEFSRIRSDIGHARNQTNLMSSVKNDIDAYRSGSGDPESMENDYMLQERSRLDHSHHMTDSVLSQAYETREEFGRQRQLLSQMNRRIMQSVSKIPGINTVISKINTRKKRDSLIMACLISFCMLMLFYFR